MQCNYNSVIQIINFDGLFRNALKCQKTGACRILVPLRYRKNTSIWHFEQCNQQLSNLICQNCDGSITILLDVGNHAANIHL